MMLIDDFFYTCVTKSNFINIAFILFKRDDLDSLGTAVFYLDDMYKKRNVDSIVKGMQALASDVIARLEDDADNIDMKCV